MLQPGLPRPDQRPHEDATKAVNLGVAAHITAAAPGGPRYDASLTPEQRSSIENAIWLCQNCAKLIDNDPARFPVALLREWKAKAEEEARARVGKTAAVQETSAGSASYVQNLQGVIAGVVVSGPGSSGTGAVNIYAHNFYAGTPPASPSPSPPQAVVPGRVDTRHGVEQLAPATRATPSRSGPRPLVVLGPQILAEGERVAVAGNVWTIRLHRFLIGDETSLSHLADADVNLLPGDRCIILSEPGEARAIAGDLSFHKEDGIFEVRVPVSPPSEKQSVMGLNDIDPETWRDAHDVAVGISALRNWLCTPLGWWSSEDDFGTWIPSWLQTGDAAQRLSDLVTMELLRLSSVPRNGLNGDTSVPLAFVERVLKVQPRIEEADDETIPVEVEVVFVGGGLWKGEVEVARQPADPAAHEKMLKVLLARASGV